MIKMKDLVLEGRDIQSKFKTNVINEESGLFRRIARYITGAETIVISLLTGTPAYLGQPSPSEYKANEIGEKICNDILVRKYGMEQTDKERPGDVLVYQIELDETNKNKFSDSKLKQIVDECIQRVSKSNSPKNVEFKFFVSLYKRGNYVKEIHKITYTPEKQMKLDF
jgi:hypothetical protein